MDAFALMMLSTGLLAMSGALLGVRALARRGQLDRLGPLGIRTKATQASEAAWVAGHRAADRWLLAAGACGVAFTVAGIAAAVALAVADRAGPAVMAVPAAGYVVVLALLARATVVASRAARQA
ncbi:MAG: hypothetical protein U0Q15_03960 [Kineosporiaceae bacterium]